jgi:hypothetical protein
MARVAGSLLAAWESGDRGRLESAVRDAAGDLETPQGSSFGNELRELLQGIVENLDGLLRSNQAGITRSRQGQVCHGLLRHAQESAAGTQV